MSPKSLTLTLTLQGPDDTQVTHRPEVCQPLTLILTETLTRILTVTPTLTLTLTTMSVLLPTFLSYNFFKAMFQHILLHQLCWSTLTLVLIPILTSTRTPTLIITLTLTLTRWFLIVPLFVQIYSFI